MKMGQSGDEFRGECSRDVIVIHCHDGCEEKRYCGCGEIVVHFILPLSAMCCLCTY